MVGRIIRFLFAGVLLIVVGIQLLPFGRPSANPPVLAEPAWDSPTTRALAKRACFDCHSNETVWPAYAYVAPISWLVTSDVIRGRHKVNFSEWNSASSSEQEVDDLPKVFRRGSMPPRKYLLLHPDAKLTDAELQQLKAGLLASLR